MRDWLLLCLSLLFCCQQLHAEQALHLKHENFEITGDCTSSSSEKLECTYKIALADSAAPLDLAHQLIKNPTRLVLDVMEARLRVGKVFKLTSHPALASVRLGIQPFGTRIVFDALPQFDVGYSVTTAGSDVRVTLALSTARTGAIRTAVPATPMSVASPIKTPDVIATTAQVTRSPAPAVPSPIAETPLPPPSPASAPKIVDARRKDSPPSPLSIPANVIRQQAELKFSVDKILVLFQSGQRPVQNLKVENTSDRTLYIAAQVEAVSNPGTSDEKLSPTDAVLVSPRKFAIEAKDEKLIRLVATKLPGPFEAAYRLTLTPQADSFDRDIELELLGRKARLNVVTALGVAVLIEPDSVRPDLSFERDDKGLTIRNQGNISVGLTEGKACLPTGACGDVPARRIYPGNEWRILVPREARFRFLRRVGDAFQTLVIPPAVD